MADATPAVALGQALVARPTQTSLVLAVVLVVTTTPAPVTLAVADGNVWVTRLSHVTTSVALVYVKTATETPFLTILARP